MDEGIKKEDNPKPEITRPENIPNKPIVRKKRLNSWKIVSFIFIILLIASLFTNGFVGITGFSVFKPKGEELSLDEASDKTLDFINTQLLGGQATAELEDANEESNLYKVSMNLNGQMIDSYVTKDGKLLFPQAISMDELELLDVEEEPEPVQEQPKAEVPKVELFVMSHCPYGTQIEKGILPVVELLGDKIDFELKFCDYAMHGEVEVREQLNQYCIQKEQSDKLLDYMMCFLEEGRSDNCLAKVGIDRSKLNTCLTETEEEYGILENLRDQTTWKGNFPTFNIYKDDVDKYSVSGSPTLVINGVAVRASRDPASLLNAICDGFEVPLEECNEELSSETPSPGFGFSETTEEDTQAQC
jgi:hypothetical protein